jgi:hypothetical protein
MSPKWLKRWPRRAVSSGVKEKFEEAADVDDLSLISMDSWLLLLLLRRVPRVPVALRTSRSIPPTVNAVYASGGGGGGMLDGSINHVVVALNRAGQGVDDDGGATPLTLGQVG